VNRKVVIGIFVIGAAVLVLRQMNSTPSPPNISSYPTAIRIQRPKVDRRSKQMSYRVRGSRSPQAGLSPVILAVRTAADMKLDIRGLKSIRLMTKMPVKQLERTRIHRPLLRDVRHTSTGKMRMRLTMMILMGIERRFRS